MLVTNKCESERYCTVQLDVFLSFSSVPPNAEMVPKIHVSWHVSSIALPQLTPRFIGPSNVKIKYLALVQERLHFNSCFMYKTGNYLEIFRANSFCFCT